MKCGLLGGKLSHSYSPQIHKSLGAYSYELFEKTPDQLEEFLKQENFQGINVTIPYKKAVIPYCDILSDRAKQLGVVNTIVRRSDGTLVGHNTDYYGFESMLKRSGLDPANKKALVLGSGGASATVSAVLEESGSNVVIISRNSKNNYQNIDQHNDAAIIVNATPVGMYPDNDSLPVDLNTFPCLEGVLDLVYNPARTQLLMQAQKRGLITQNGLWMLVAQAVESAEWFTGTKYDEKIIETIHSQLSSQMQNIVLIGMPGSGKSTIGQYLSKSLGRAFIDVDAEIAARAGLSIPEIFRIFGEDGFRKLETEALKEICKKSGIIIATGGGCITKDENYNILRQNSRIIWIQRDINRLPTAGRPLSQTYSLQEMYKIREPLYQHFADDAITNDSDVANTAKKILDLEGIL